MNAGYAFFLLFRNRSWWTFGIAGGSRAYRWAILTGLFWFAALGVYGQGAALMGSLGPIVGWPILLGLALVGAVVGELFGATQGVGELIYSAEHNFNANGVFAGMLLLAAMALLAEAIITALENRLVRWRPPAVGSEVQI